MNFKKYKNRKIYNTEKSCYATVGEVFKASIEADGQIAVRDAVTGRDLTAETIIRGAIDTLTYDGLLVLAIQAMKIGLSHGTKPEPLTGAKAKVFIDGKPIATFEGPVSLNAEQSPTLGTLKVESTNQEDDLFSGEGL